ncbi:hypothetical protein L210DRAFT_2168762 [Boletus edulis BED1]|uniref:Secreted protein n=1 Tax=Boletus edulis BED1 TaxID=1328754 RepID=A0AAD4G4A4_BOLED|nr:hypothetical protein L210DRAFT_2902074 [Boletus edulis BED1]KAF8422340.1 hypothetical protein L210DRAFT_2168762 [Boletus edulis BED1]
MPARPLSPLTHIHFIVVFCPSTLSSNRLSPSPSHTPNSGKSYFKRHACPFSLGPLVGCLASNLVACSTRPSTRCSDIPLQCRHPRS